MANGIEWLMELNAKLDEATRMVRELDKVESATRKADKAMRGAEKQVSLFQRGLAAAGRSFGSFGRTTLAHMTAMVSIGGFTRLASGISRMATGALDAAAEMEKARLSYRLLLGEADGDALLAALDKASQLTEFTGAEIRALGGDLIQAGFKGEAFGKALLAAADIAAVTRSGVQGASQAIRLLSQVSLKGMFEKGELSQVGIEFESVIGRLSGALGVGTAEIKKRLAQGKIDTSLALDAIYAEIQAKTGKGLGAAAREASTTFATSLKKTKDILPTLFENLERSPGLAKLSETLQELTKMFSPDSPTGKAMLRSFSDTLESFAASLAKIDPQQIANVFAKLPAIIEAGTKAVVGLVNALSNLLDLFASAKTDAGPAAVAKQTTGARIGGGIRSVIAPVEGALQKVFPIKEGNSGLTGALHSIVTLGHLTERLSGDFRAAGESATAGMASGITSGSAAAEKSAKKLGERTAGATKTALQIRSPSAVFADFGFQTSAGFSLGLENSIPDLVGTMGRVFDPALLVPPVPFVPSPIDVLGIPPVNLPALDSLAAGAAGSLPLPPVVMGGAGGGGSHFEANVTVNVGGNFGGPEADQQVGEAAALATRHAIERIFSQMAAEGGAA